MKVRKIMNDVKIMKNMKVLTDGYKRGRLGAIRKA
jgi:hypothetical protein